jgi:ribonuclease T1
MRVVAAGAALIALLLPACGGGEDPPASATTAQGDGVLIEDERLAPDEAAAVTVTLAAIDSGDPLPYDQDGATFQNREGLLPDMPEGYYREYTVETPGSDDRGARRLVIGEAGETYYTRDHYSSFIEIDQEDFK